MWKSEMERTHRQCISSHYFQQSYFMCKILHSSQTKNQEKLLRLLETSTIKGWGKNISDGNEKVFLFVSILLIKQTRGIVKIWTELQHFIVVSLFFFYLLNILCENIDLKVSWVVFFARFQSFFFVCLNTRFLCEQIAIRRTNLTTKCLTSFSSTFHYTFSALSFSFFRLKWQIWDERFMQIFYDNFYC